MYRGTWRQSIWLLVIVGVLSTACGRENDRSELSDSSDSGELPVLTDDPGDQNAASQPLRPNNQIDDTGRSADSDSGWMTVRPGLERRVINEADVAGGSISILYILRLDPSGFRFDIGYRPGSPQSLLRWHEETEALVIVNGGFFSEENLATGLVIKDGIPSGSSYVNYGGMLLVQDGSPELRWLKEKPYDPSEPIDEAFQSFPVLIMPGGKVGYKNEDTERARRTVVAEDRIGRFLLIVTPTATFSLSEISSYLIDSDLDIDFALNLDGGASSGLYLAETGEGIPSLSELPLVLLVYAR